MGHLPTFETLRATAYGLLGDAEDWLRSDWQQASQPTPAQLAALRQARTHIGRAKAALNRAAS